jgi:hypothetical protein
MDKSTLAALLEKLKEGGPFRHRCGRCNQTREIIVRIEYEHGEAGSVLSAWPEFDLDPPCPGLVCQENDIVYDERPPTEEELNDCHDPEREYGANCPFGKYFDMTPDIDQERVLGRYAERKLWRRELS